MKITQRTATLEDGNILLTWRNHPSARKFSGQPKQILSEEHFEWLTARLERVQIEPFFLFVEDFQAIGMSRLDIISGTIDKYEISILVDPNQHGKGVGTKILNITCEIFFGLNPDYTIVARIHQDNLVSQKLFMGAGFELFSSLGNFLHLEKNL